ncbi:MAG TPA: protein disulfide oxidoreductase [Solibacterales bacterium]|nr:protein disulfide oxidoreductase [Bryobacterales bacterium]
MHTERGASPAEAAAPSRARRIRRWALEIALVIVAFFAIQWWLTRDVLRGPLPPLDAPMVNAVSFDKWRAEHGRDGFVLYVWATWCPVCKTIEGSVESVAQDTPVVTVAMNSGDAAAVQAFLQQRNHRWPTLIDADGRLSLALGVDAVPTLIFVDRHGRVRGVTQGYTTMLGMRARLWWASPGG